MPDCPALLHALAQFTRSATLPSSSGFEGITMDVAEFKPSLLIWRNVPLVPDFRLDTSICILLKALEAGIFARLLRHLRPQLVR
eukprot:11621284-Heterocapsa_arctica.AAC.1